MHRYDLTERHGFVTNAFDDKKPLEAMLGKHDRSHPTRISDFAIVTPQADGQTTTITGVNAMKRSGATLVSQACWAEYLGGMIKCKRLA